MCITYQLESGNVGFWGEGKTVVPKEKTSWSKDENQQKTQPMCCMTPSLGIDWVLVGGECSPLCTIPAPSLLPFAIISSVATHCCLIKANIVSLPLIVTINIIYQKNATPGFSWSCFEPPFCDVDHWYTFWRVVMNTLYYLIDQITNWWMLNGNKRM